MEYACIMLLQRAFAGRAVIANLQTSCSSNNSYSFCPFFSLD